MANRGNIPKYPQRAAYLQEAKSSFNKLGDKGFAKLNKIAKHALLF